MSESVYRVLFKDRWSRTYHDGSDPKAKAGGCTVTGMCDRRARWSIHVRSTRLVRGKYDESWLASCDQDLPPLAPDARVLA
jgi:hypothetical protein